MDAVERAIEDNVPAEYQQHAHHWLILHGRYICVARKPKCGICPIRDLCPYRGEDRMKTYQVVGIGNAIVDVFSQADDSFLDLMGIEKGIMQLVERERGELLYGAMHDRVQAPGGSVANTLAGLGNLGLTTAFIGRVHDDALGRFYARSMAEEGTDFVNPPVPGRRPAHLALDDLRLARWRAVDEHLSRHLRPNSAPTMCPTAWRAGPRSCSSKAISTTSPRESRPSNAPSQPVPRRTAARPASRCRTRSASTATATTSAVWSRSWTT